MYNSELNTPKTELVQRIGKLKSHLRQHDIEAALILQRVDLFYFSGTCQQGALYIPADGEPVLMVNKNTERARAESYLDTIVHLESPKRIPDIIKSKGYDLPATLGMELDVLPTQLYFTYRKLFQDTDIKDISLVIRFQRAVKSPYELGIMRLAGELSDQVAEWVPNILRAGITELELAGLVEAEARRLGHQGVCRMRLWGSEMFYGHLLSGPAAAVPSYLSSPTGGTGASPAIAQGPSFKTIQRHEPVMVDYIFAYNGYLSDHTRIFSLGALPQELLDGHAAMLEVQQMIKQIARPGITSGEIYDQALAKTRQMGYEDHFMGAGGERVRFVGHGIGLEVDEFPFLAAGQKFELQVGMTIALEPKLIFPGQGVVGIENSHVVTEKGLEQMGRYPEDIVIV
ncbi:Xaa-Pro aminopeptidase (EC [Olavius algarvensis Delta 1 endosymbiont]|nr:Xaa-Pro aminopeptidase (EC [Olavius algarvensis Delta 1 endosymbiont]